jgi:hypothetical protein
MTALTVVAEKEKTPSGADKPNLESVTVSVPPPEPEAMDTTTPMDTSVLPFTHRDLPKWGPWTKYRMSQIWPHISNFSFVSQTAQIIADNSKLFIRSKYAILLASQGRETLDTRPVVDIVFCFMHHPERAEELADVKLLIKRVDEWSRRLGAKYIRAMHPERIDASFTTLKTYMLAKEDKLILKDLDR